MIRKTVSVLSIAVLATALSMPAYADSDGAGEGNERGMENSHEAGDHDMGRDRETFEKRERRENHEYKTVAGSNMNQNSKMKKVRQNFNN